MTADRKTIMDPQLRGILQLLQTQPRAYRGFGWLWWVVKGALKAQGVTKDELFYLGNANDARAVALAMRTFGSAQAAIDAARDHYEQRAYRGLVYALDDHLPDGAAYRLTDPDAGIANL